MGVRVGPASRLVQPIEPGLYLSVRGAAAAAAQHEAKQLHHLAVYQVAITIRVQPLECLVGTILIIEGGVIGAWELRGAQ